jgi:hypothetical protein
MEPKDLIQNGLENAKRGFNRTLDGLTATELKWQPRPDANSIGLIFFHSIRTEDSSIHRLQGKPQIWESEQWYQKFHKVVDDGGAHYTAEQVAGFVVPDLGELLTYAATVRKDTLEYLNGLRAEDFDKKVNLPAPPTPAAHLTARPAPPRPPLDPTVGSMLLMLVTHLSQHVGDTAYIRGLQRGMDK